MLDIWHTIPSCPLYEINQAGVLRHSITRKLKASHPNKKGYLRVMLYMTYPATQHHRKSFYIARLVYEAFRGTIPNGMTVNHKDGNKQHNHPSNLELMTASENTRHAARILQKQFGALGHKNGQRKLTEQDIPSIRARLASGESQASIARAYGGMSRHAIYCIAHGHTWRHIP